ncbi:MAG: hypothetical protein LBP40_03300 [Campylobacteraceae bacterium]|jgi:hypothetical protein|nr:hypothetical protein [Campylobacteraceae bacterium]
MVVKMEILKLFLNLAELYAGGQVIPKRHNYIKNTVMAGMKHYGEKSKLKFVGLTACFLLNIASCCNRQVHAPHGCRIFKSPKCDKRERNCYKLLHIPD